MTRIGVVPALAMLGAIVCSSGVALGADAPAGSTAVVLVEVNGVKITLADLEQKHPAVIFQARTNYYETERKAIEEMADQALLDQQAKKEGLTVAELLERHVNSTIAKDPSEEALHVYYEGIDTAEPYEAVRAKILDALRQRRTAKAKAAYMASLRSQSSIVIRLAPPRAPISMKDVSVRGAANAQVTLLEYADFECPYCQQIQPVLDKIEAEFKGKVAFAYKDFPLPMHPDAQKAAEATRCAAAQGKYWEFHDMLFARKQLGVPDLKNDAAELKLDTAAFGACLDGGQMAGVVKDSASEAAELGVQGTPTFYVNGRYVSGTANYERLRSIITEELSAQEMNTGLAAQNRQHD
ncbi:MAG: thioredoxin domain-containing protein [Bryobacteraceae bacterium]